ncbi:Unknown protein sequence [Pseudomonas amygdali pv. lachrymans]|nr:Unknown protein sequence [Pseudomonas amygdali pv. lachrymans]
MKHCEKEFAEEFEKVGGQQRQYILYEGKHHAENTTYNKACYSSSRWECKP